MCSKYSQLLIGVFLILCGWGLESHSDQFLELPWFSNPLLTPTPWVVQEGHQSYHPYVYWSQQTKHYDEHWHAHKSTFAESLLLRPVFKWGILPRTELDITPNLWYRHSLGHHTWRLGDVSLSLGYQILHDHRLKNWACPDLRLNVGCILPIGHYDRFNPSKEFVDNAGGGSWQPSLTLLIGKFFHFTQSQWLAIRSSFSYAFATAVSVHGISRYGGTEHTRGTVYPGHSWIASLGMELSVTQKVALACDLTATHTDRSRFSGRSGGMPPKKPSFNELVVAPGIEYNRSSRLGFTVGPAITFAGRNTAKQTAWIASMTLRT